MCGGTHIAADDNSTRLYAHWGAGLLFDILGGSEETACDAAKGNERHVESSGKGHC